MLRHIPDFTPCSTNHWIPSRICPHLMVGGNLYEVYEGRFVYGPENSSRCVFREVRKEGILVLSLLYAAGDKLGREHLHLVGNHLDTRALYFLTVDVLPLCEATFEIDFRAFVQIAFADLGKVPPDHDVEPFGLLDFL